MKKTIILVTILLIFVGCNNGDNRQSADTTGVPSAIDTVPVLHPGRFDTSGVIKTPETNDENVIVPDSAINK